MLAQRKALAITSSRGRAIAEVLATAKDSTARIMNIRMTMAKTYTGGLQVEMKMDAAMQQTSPSEFCATSQFTYTPMRIPIPRSHMPTTVRISNRKMAKKPDFLKF